jgi:predicted site-specific integrase-resolvase
MVEQCQEGQMNDIKYLDIPATARRFGVSIMTIRRYIWAGKFRTVRHGHRYAVELESVREYFSDKPEVRDGVGRWNAEATAG